MGRVQEAYEDALTEMSTEWAPWYVVPADRKWVRNVAIATIVAATLDENGSAISEGLLEAERFRDRISQMGAG